MPFADIGKMTLGQALLVLKWRRELTSGAQEPEKKAVYPRAKDQRKRKDGQRGSAS